MKKILSLLIVLAGLAGAHAQGTFHFTVNLSGQNEVPPNNSAGVGTAQLTLTGNALDIFLDIPAVPYGFTPIGAFIHGPAVPGATAPIIFDLGAYRTSPPIFPLDPGGYEFVLNNVNVSASQIADLMNGFWYINVTSSGFPDGEIRGQIQPVPEPSTLALLGLGGLTVLLLRRSLLIRAKAL
jgi:hypothetical protein